jgi:hypothetical protein
VPAFSKWVSKHYEWNLNKHSLIECNDGEIENVKAHFNDLPNDWDGTLYVA